MRSKTLLRTTRAPALSKLGKVSRHYFLDFYFTWFYTIISKIILAIIHDFCQYFKTFVIFQNLMRIFYNKWIIWKLFQGTVYIRCQRCRWNFHLIMHIFFLNKYFLLTTILKWRTKLKCCFFRGDSFSSSHVFTHSLRYFLQN